MKIILSYGMGVESTVILHRWITDPSSRDFDLDDLVVLTAQTGDEFPDTKELVEEHMLPLIREAGIRYVQVARDNPTQSLRVLSDTTDPRAVYLNGKYRLSDEMLGAGTIPQYASGSRHCSIHGKGWPLDLWIDGELEGEFRHIIGFNAEEKKRVTRDKSYSTEERHSEYPLLDWGWGRKACEDYLEDAFGEPWAKSCCFYCPFAAGREPVRIRYRKYQGLAAFAAFMEYMSLCFNPRMTLYTNKSLIDVLDEDGNEGALRLFHEHERHVGYAIYHVRRLYFGPSNADRSLVRMQAQGSRQELERLLIREEGAEQDERGIVRAVRIPLEKKTRKVILDGKKKTILVEPTAEEMFVVAPAFVQDKVADGFEAHWPYAVSHQWWPSALKSRAKRGIIDNPYEGPDFDYTTQEDDGREDQARYECDLADVLPEP